MTDTQAAVPQAQRPLVLIETHGCKLNMADSQRMARELVAAGYGIAGPDDVPDVYVLDTCTVTHVADRKARQALAGARRAYPDALIVATGCFVQRDAGGVDHLPAVDMVLTNTQKRDLSRAVTDRLGPGLTPCGDGQARSGAGALLGRSRASVKIQEGCDQVCAYCIVPYVRGRERSVPADVLVRQVARLAEEGCREVVLTGTQLGTYGFDLPDADLAGLLRRLLLETAIERLRVSSLQPLEIGDDLLRIWDEEGRGRLCPHFHLPLQSGSDDVLRRMRRRYTSRQFIAAAGRVRDAVPEASITGDVIAGFPGESDADHRATVDLIKEIGFAGLHVFPYSSRPGTTAAHLAGHVDARVKSDRAAQIREIASDSARACREAAVGSVRPVLWEGGSPATGLTDTYLRVRRAGATDESVENVIEQVRLVRLDRALLVGEPVKGPPAHRAAVSRARVGTGNGG